VLSASGQTIPLGGTGQADPAWAKSPAWKTYSQQLTDAGVDGFQAARNRNLVDLMKVNEQWLASCDSCHKEFKPESPTEGRVHDPD
jgi:cytochrome c556